MSTKVSAVVNEQLLLVKEDNQSTKDEAFFAERIYNRHSDYDCARLSAASSAGILYVACSARCNIPLQLLPDCLLFI